MVQLLKEERQHVHALFLVTHIVVLVARHEELRHVDRENVGEQLLVVGLQVLHLLLLL